VGDLTADDVRVDGVRLAYLAAGDPQAPPAVLLHALGEDATTWQVVSAVLAADRRVYALDLRGHGRSDWPGEYSLERMRDDVIGFLDARGLRRVTLVGHSMGAVVAYLVAQRRPDAVDRLILEDPLPPVPADPPRPLPPRPAGPLGFDWAVAAAINPQRNAPKPAWWNGLARITAPTLIVAGGPDSHLPQDRIAGMAAMIRDCRLVTIPAGHLVHQAQPALFLAAVATFLASVRPDHHPPPPSVRPDHHPPPPSVRPDHHAPSPGHPSGVDTTITYLEMTSPDQLRPARDDPAVELTPAAPGTPLIRSVVERIGAPHEWAAVSYPEQKWRDWLADTRLRQWLVRCGGQVAGLVELGVEPGGEVEIATFGLVPEYVGRGFGGPALTLAVRLAWQQGEVPVRRVWLHTSSADHPNALPNYLKRGFRPVRTEVRAQR
jgi:pimeloyl-ACP methyl ester carboxylesterase/GNAT superfamily N-acetyltransferase